MPAKHILNNVSIPAVVGFAALLFACASNASTVEGNKPTPSSTIDASIANAPACGIEKANARVSKILTHQSANAREDESGWQEVALEPTQTIDLQALTNGMAQEVGVTGLPAGHYAQFRLVLTSGCETVPFTDVGLFKGGADIALDADDAEPHGLKLKISAQPTKPWILN